MINNETAKMTYTIIEGVSTYAIGFSYAKNPDGTPQIKVYLNKISIAPLVYGVDYTLSEDGLSIILASVTSGDRLDIIRDIPLVQLSDYVIGRIDPEQIENDFDKTVMRDQQIQANIDFVGEVPEDHEVRIQECETDIDNIESLIPNQTTSVNQLADKEFVNSSIATSTATFRGTYSTLAELEAVTADDNDYGFVESVDAAGNTLYSRYKYSNGSWVFEYNLNNSSFTAAQWAAINSGITEGIVNTFNATGHNVGDIFYTMRNDNDLNGAIECNGLQYNTTDFTGGESIGALLESGKLPYVSLADYATALAANGSVGVFGWDGAGTTAFRVPSLNDIFVETGTAAQIGDYLSAGVPNIIGQVSGANQYGKYAGFQDASGAFYVDDNGTVVESGSGGSKARTLHIDASRSSAIYGNSATVQPNAVRYRAMVQLMVAATDEALTTCTSVLADVAILKYDYVVDFQAPTAENDYTWYRKYKSGWVEQGGNATLPQQSANTSASATLHLPIAMQNNKYSVVENRIADGGSSYELTQIGVNRTVTDCSVLYFSTIATSGASVVNMVISGMAA